MSAIVHAEEPKPGTGTNIQTVHLSEIVPARCVAVTADGGVATIVLSREELDGLAGFDKPVDDNNALTRQAWINGTRAKALLTQLGAIDARGCQVVQGTLPFDVRFVVGLLLEEGHATIFTRQLNLPEPVLEIRHVNKRFFGWEEFRLLNGTQVWSYDTWTA
ncbi:hypothetical protein [Rhodanobacter sp. L36]|uniref:hypothetical protein n=1 Tax=Rhodanobacter sp. L36 TaxID=1747221 RepID=UPI00131CA306|nr:hypothetical protein [Rhodanobacter sp. L36]